MKITLVEPQKKTLHQRFGQAPRRFNIFLDGQFAFGADEDLVVERRLIVGKEIQKEDLGKFLEEAEIGKLMERMYKWFGVRMRSEWEVRQKFKILGKELVSDLIIEALINKLKQKGMLNDLEFAKAWVESRSKKKGKNALKAELFKKGINKEIIEEVLVSSNENENQTAQKLLEKKMRLWKNLPEMEFKQKAFRFLVSRGFEYDLSKEIVENALKEV